jgi:mRNA interferase MazF
VTLNSGDVVTVDFPDVTGIKRRPAVVISSTTYHSQRPDIIVGLIICVKVALVDLEQGIFKSF